MKTFRDLYIQLNGADIETFSSILEEHAQAPWVRRKDKEQELHATGGGPICFELSQGSNLNPSLLFIFPKDNFTLWVSNIVPTTRNELTYDEYNSVLESFYNDIVLPATNGSTILARLTSNSISIGSIAGQEVENAFKRFSNAANKSTGSSHPMDRRRWFEFIVLAHESNAELHTDIIIRGLSELGWSEEKAIELGIEFEFAEDLLSYMNER